MNNLLSKFSTHLLNIGFATPDTITHIHTLFNEILSSKPSPSSNPTSLEDSFKESMLATLIYYLSSLSDTSKESISLSLLLKFFSSPPALSKLKSSILLCNAKHLSPSLLHSFQTWKSSSKRRKPKSAHEISSYSTRRPYKKSHNNSSTYSYRQPHLTSSTEKKCPKYERLRIETSVDKKEKEDLNECTFHPDTTLSNSYHRPTSCVNDTNTVANNESVYDRLYKDNEKYESKRQIKKLELEHMLSEKYNFKPSLVATPNKFRRKSKIKFNERQKSFIDKKTQNKQKLQYIMDEDFNTKCSFSPKINPSSLKSNFISNKKSSSPAHIRLYEDDKHRRIKTNQKLREINQQIADQCNSFMSRRSNIHHNTHHHVNTSSSNSFNNNNGVDTRKIEELYKQYKKRPAKIQRLRQALENENGITFEPYLNRNNQYYAKINTNVLERSEQFIQYKKDFVKAVNDAQNRYWKENMYGYRKYSPLEKEEITQRIIQRLYGKGYMRNENGEENRNGYMRDEEEKEEDGMGEEEMDENMYVEEDRIVNYEMQKGMENVHNEVIEKEEEEEEDVKYNDKIISIDEYNFGKNKKKKYG